MLAAGMAVGLDLLEPGLRRAVLAGGEALRRPSVTRPCAPGPMPT